MAIEVPKSDVRKRPTPHDSALPPYIGGKRRIAPLIFREIDRIIPRRYWDRLTFLDAFMGGGSVSLYAKAQQFSVVSCDIAERCLIVGRALIENNSVKLTQLDVIKVAHDDGHDPGPVEIAYVPKVFMRKQARLLDRILRAADEAKSLERVNMLRLLALRVMLLTQPMSRPRSGTIDRMAEGEYESITPSCIKQYVDGLSLTRQDRLWALAQDINAGVFPGKGRVVAGDSFQNAATTEADVAYFDPPYPGTQSYEKYYYILDEVFEGKRKPENPVSGAGGGQMIEQLLRVASEKFPLYALSLNNAVMDSSQLAEISTANGRETVAIEVPYRHAPNMQTEEERSEHREIIVLSWSSDRVEEAIRRVHG